MNPHTRLLLTLLIGCTLPGCEGRNPAQISAERSGKETEVRAHPQVGPSTRGAERPPVAAPPPGNEDRMSVPPDGLLQVDLAGALQSGALSIEVNDPVFPPRLPRLFDGDTESLSRSENVNPLVLIFRFNEGIPLKTVRIYPSYSAYDWSLRVAPEEQGVVVRSASQRQWSRIDLPAPVATRTITIELRRLERDDFVHLNEVEFYTEP